MTASFVGGKQLDTIDWGEGDVPPAGHVPWLLLRYPPGFQLTFSSQMKDPAAMAMNID